MVCSPVRVSWALLLPILVAVAAVPTDALARCMSSYVEVWPARGETVPTNARIVVHAGGTVWEHASFQGLTLRSGREVVRLEVAFDQWQPGPQSGRRTIVLAPATPLRAHARYQLRASVPGAGAVRTAFTVGTAADTHAPSAPRVDVGAFQNHELGCGPAQSIPLAVSGAQDDVAAPGALFVRLRVAASEQDLRASRLRADIIEPLTATLALGHGMCSGNFDLEPGDSLVATLTVADRAMNESAPSRVLRLTAR